MTIECYYTACPHHCTHNIDDEGPFCYENHCKATIDQLEQYKKIRKLYLKTLKEQMDTYDTFVTEQKRIWFGKLWMWRVNKFLKSLNPWQ